MFARNDFLFSIFLSNSIFSGTSNGRGSFQFNLQTYTDSEYIHEQTTGYKTGEIMYFDVTIDREVEGLEFTGKTEIISKTEN